MEWPNSDGKVHKHKLVLTLPVRLGEEGKSLDFPIIVISTG